MAPTAREARAIGKACRPVGSGEAASEKLAGLLREQRPDTLLILGLCGGLDPSLATGDLILAREVIDEAGEAQPPPPTTLASARRALRNEGPNFVSSRLLTVREPVATRAAKRDLWNTHGAAGVDMETAGFARAAKEQGVDWMALRVVIDPAGATLPASLREWRGDEDERSIARRIAKRPQEWLAYGRLAAGLRPAFRALRAGARIVARVSRDTVPLGDDLMAPAPPR